MRKMVITMATALLSMGLYAQVGIGTDTPRATLDVQPNIEHLTSTATTNEGIIPPKISKTRLAQIANDKLVKGTIVYIDNITYTASPTNVKVGKVTSSGYYIYNGSSWERLDTNIYNQDGALTGDRNVYLNYNNLNFKRGRIGRNIDTPRSAVDLGDYNLSYVLHLVGTAPVNPNDGLIPPRMSKRYLHFMTDDVTDGTIVYLYDLTVPTEKKCSIINYINGTPCPEVPVTFKFRMSEMTEKGLYIFNKEADKWLPLKSGRYTGTNGVTVSGNTIRGNYYGSNGISVSGSRIALDNTTKSNVDNVYKHRLVPINQINQRSGRTRITGTAGYWEKENNYWVYFGQVYMIAVNEDTGYWSYLGTASSNTWMVTRASYTDTSGRISTDCVLTQDFNRIIRLSQLYKSSSDTETIGLAVQTRYDNYLPMMTQWGRGYGKIDALVRPVPQLWLYDE